VGLVISGNDLLDRVEFGGEPVSTEAAGQQFPRLSWVSRSTLME
jgi:hypothetical protein